MYRYKTTYISYLIFSSLSYLSTEKCFPLLICKLSCYTGRQLLILFITCITELLKTTTFDGYHIKIFNQCKYVQVYSVKQ